MPYVDKINVTGSKVYWLTYKSEELSFHLPCSMLSGEETKGAGEGTVYQNHFTHSNRENHTF